MRIEIFRLDNFGAGAARKAKRFQISRVGIHFKAFRRLVCCFW